MNLDQILDLLNRFHQRATYGAVAHYLTQQGQPTVARAVMMGRQRDHRHSWVVSLGGSLPTGYQPGQMHPNLGDRGTVLLPPAIMGGVPVPTRLRLQAWLNDPR